MQRNAHFYMHITVVHERVLYANNEIAAMEILCEGTSIFGTEREQYGDEEIGGDEVFKGYTTRSSHGLGQERGLETFQPFKFGVYNSAADEEATVVLPETASTIEVQIYQGKSVPSDLSATSMTRDIGEVSGSVPETLSKTRGAMTQVVPVAGGNEQVVMCDVNCLSPFAPRVASIKVHLRDLSWLVRNKIMTVDGVAWKPPAGGGPSTGGASTVPSVPRRRKASSRDDACTVVINLCSDKE